MSDPKGFDSVKDALKARILSRYLPGETVAEDAAIDEFSHTIYDRLLIQLDTDEMPDLGLSIVVDATMKALRLRGYEGSRSESDSDGGSISNTFIDDVLDAYKTDISSLKQRSKRISPGGVKFL